MKFELFSDERCERVLTAAFTADSRVRKHGQRVSMDRKTFREFVELAFSNGCYIGESAMWNAIDVASRKFRRERVMWMQAQETAKRNAKSARKK